MLLVVIVGTQLRINNDLRINNGQVWMPVAPLGRNGRLCPLVRPVLRCLTAAPGARLDCVTRRSLQWNGRHFVHFHRLSIGQLLPQLKIDRVRPFDWIVQQFRDCLPQFCYPQFLMK